MPTTATLTRRGKSSSSPAMAIHTLVTGSASGDTSAADGGYTQLTTSSVALSASMIQPRGVIQASNRLAAAATCSAIALSSVLIACQRASRWARRLVRRAFLACMRSPGLRDTALTERVIEVGDPIPGALQPDRDPDHGVAEPDPRLLTGTIDLAGATQGGRVIDCSNMHYSSPEQILLPDRARMMGDGWENARRRGEGNDHVTVALGLPGRVRRVEVDTSYFLGNAPGEAMVRGRLGSPGEQGDWVTLLPRTRLQPDTRHVFAVAPDAVGARVDHVRLDVYPDGGLARFRVLGELSG